MAGGQINIQIGGNAQQLTQAAGQASNALNQVGNAATQAAPALTGAGTAAQAAGRGLNAIPPAAGPAGQGLGSVGQAAAVAARGLNALAPAIRPNIQGLTFLNSRALDAQRALNLVGNPANQTANALGNTGRGANQASAALTDVGRIAQDLPFGFIGIQNNLNPLLESFRRLRLETGNNRAAFRALVGSLLGAGGVGLALSAVSAAILIYQNGIAGFNRKSKEAKEAADEYKKSLQGIASELADEASRVSILVQALQGDVLTRKEKTAALKELKGINSEYFGQLKDEKGFLEELKVAYDNYLKSLKEQFAAKALSKQLDVLFEKRLQLEIALDPALSAQTDKNITTTLNRLQGELRQLGGVEILKGSDLTNLTAAQKRVSDLVILIKQIESTKVVDFTKGFKEKELADINKQIDGILNRVGAFGKTGLDLKLSADGKDKPDEQLKKLKEELQGLQAQLQVTNKLREAGLLPLNRENDALQLQLKIFDLLDQIDAREVAIKTKPKLEIDPQLTELEIQKAFREFAIRSGKAIEVPLIIRPRPIIETNPFSPAEIIAPNGIPPNAFDGVVNAIRRSAENAKSRVAEIAIDLKEVLSSVLTNAFTGLGEAIGNAFSGGGFQSVIAGFISLLGDAISALGKAAIQAGTAALIAKETINKFIIKNPALVIAAGIAAVAIGQALKNSFNNTKISGFADGVNNFAGGAALVGERGPEIVTLPAGASVIPSSPFDAFNSLTLISEIRGEDIYLSNRRVTGRRRRI